MCASEAHAWTQAISQTATGLEVSNHLRGYSTRMAFLKQLIKPHLALHIPQGRSQELQAPHNPLSLPLPFAPCPLSCFTSLLSPSLLCCLFIRGSCLVVGYLGCPRAASLFSVTSPCGYYSKIEQ